MVTKYVYLNQKVKDQLNWRAVEWDVYKEADRKNLARPQDHFTWLTPWALRWWGGGVLIGK